MSNSTNSLKKITFVCLGNICRSPLAHTIMEKKLAERNLSSNFSVDSSGLGNWHVGNPSDKRMQATASAHGYTITHRSQQFHWQDAENFDYIFAMDRSIYESILNAVSSNYHNKVMMFCKFDIHKPDCDIPDPYYGGAGGFEKVFQMVEENCEKIIDELLLKKK